MMRIELRVLQHKDAAEFWKLAFSDENAEWTKWNGPYFHDKLPTKKDFLAGRAMGDYIDNPLKKVILLEGKMIGMVSAYYEDGALKKWLDIGIVLYDQTKWQQHVGFRALSLWIDEMFMRTNLPHIGLTTWSGNYRMIGLAEKLGLKKEAEVRQVRYYKKKYWDSVKYRTLRAEWENTKAGTN